MASVVSPTRRNEAQPAESKPNRATSPPAVSPEQVWGLLTPAQQQQVMRVVIQVGRILALSEAQGVSDEHD